ncbi:hypothetical protein JX266_014526, partial [Neoarthrinium moseri]
MENELAQLRRQLAEAESRALTEQRRREEEQRRREAAEALAKDSQPQTLRQYLEAGHALSLAIQTVTDPTSTTQGEPTKPTGR